MMDSLKPDSFPSLRNLSAAFLQRLVLVPKARPQQREYFYVPVATESGEARWRAMGFFARWGMNWESGPYRVNYFSPDELRSHLPARLAARLEQESDEVDVHLVPSIEGERNHAYDALYHLLPLRTLRRFGLPVRERGLWPACPDASAGERERGTRSETRRLRKAFAHHIWPLISPAAPMRALGHQDSLILLAHDLDFWFPHLDRVIEEMLSRSGRCEVTDDDYKAATIEADRQRVQAKLPRLVEALRPRKGAELWRGEEGAWQITKELVERADQEGRLRAMIDAIRAGREQDDFSPIWSRLKEDFERKMFRKRSKVRVSFVELHDTTAVYGPDAEVVDSMLWKNLFALADPRERRVIVCLRSGVTRASDIAAELGYQNHSPVSKALQRIRTLAERLLE